ncbi:MAG: ribBA [Chloroflexi bacterium]|nr:ribBA [Chloroflexota bacterium]
MNTFAGIQEAVADFRGGKFVLILDAERENEGDVAIAAEYVTASAVNFLATHARGLICMPMLGERLDHLGIPPMVSDAPSGAPAFTVSVDARRGITSGISAEDRAWTVKTLIHPLAQRNDLERPGHMFPLRYAEGGVLRRAGHTEASVDLAMLAGCYPAAVICEVMNADGTMARLPQLQLFAREHCITMISLEQLIAHRRWLDRVADDVRQAVGGLVR